MNPPVPPADLTVVTITPDALEDIHRHAAAAPEHHETGGILLGHEHPARIAITTAGDPGPEAQHAPTHFRRDLAHARHLADHAHRVQGAVWIGEWHTHPRGPNGPSPRDMATYRSFLVDPELEFAVVVALIVSPRPSSAPAPRQPRDIVHPWVVHAWVVDTVAVAPTALHVTPDPPSG